MDRDDVVRTIDVTFSVEMPYGQRIMIARFLDQDRDTRRLATVEESQDFLEDYGRYGMMMAFMYTNDI